MVILDLKSPFYIFFYQFIYEKKRLFHIDLGFILFFVVLSRRLVLYLLVKTFCFSWSCCDVLFVCGRFKHKKNILSNRDNKSDYDCHYAAKMES